MYLREIITFADNILKFRKKLSNIPELTNMFNMNIMDKPLFKGDSDNEYMPSE